MMLRLTLLAALVCAPANMLAEPKLPPIYDTAAKGEAQIAKALDAAKQEDKRVLLQFGANWCIWCHRLHEVFETDAQIARLLEAEYELVLIDVDTVDGQKHNADVDARYGRPTRHGLPTLVVLDAEGRQLTTRETASWEVWEAYDTAKILAFLERWRPPRDRQESS